MKVIRWLDRNLEECCMAVLLVLIACIMMAQVIMRYLFKASMPWPEECCRHGYMVYHTFLSMAALRASGQLSPAMKMPVWILYLVLGIGFALGAVRYLEQVVRGVRKGKTIC